MNQRYVWLVCLCLILNGCQSAPKQASGTVLPPIRFLLTFDDGPSSDPEDNTTLRILRILETNSVQPGTKALFFVQTRNADGGGSSLGRHLLKKIHEQGHALGLHSGSVHGHLRHTWMDPVELSQSLLEGASDLRRVAGEQPLIVRPTFWSYNQHTVALYTQHGFGMLLTDVNSRDGVWIMNLLGLRLRLHLSLQAVQKEIARHELPVHDGVIPLVVTFHDLNPITARYLGDYMKSLTDAAKTAGLQLAAKPFYDSRETILDTASLRAVTANNLARHATSLPLNPSSLAPGQSR